MASLRRKSRRQVFAKFWSMVKIGRPENCWPFLGALDNDGYGIFSENGKSVRANRIAFRLAEGREARPMALHTCNNRKCCNPAHLYEGTALRNMMDCINSGNFRTVYIRGEGHPNAKLTDAQWDEVIDQIQLGRKQNAVAKQFGVTAGAIVYQRRRRGL